MTRGTFLAGYLFFFLSTYIILSFPAQFAMVVVEDLLFVLFILYLDIALCWLDKGNSSHITLAN